MGSDLTRQSRRSGVQKTRHSPTRHDDLLRHIAMLRKRSSERHTSEARVQLGAPDDKYESEADRIAHAVVSGPNHVSVRSASGTGGTRAANRLPTPAVANVAAPKEALPESVGQVLTSGQGRPLDASTREFMESRFGGNNFSQVRVHTDAQSAKSAETLNALAYTTGRNIVFGVGRYTPSTTNGKKLLAHELTHVVQQDSAGADRFVLRRKLNDFRTGFESPRKVALISVRWSDDYELLLPRIISATVNSPAFQGVPRTALDWGVLQEIRRLPFRIDIRPGDIVRYEISGWYDLGESIMVAGVRIVDAPPISQPSPDTPKSDETTESERTPTPSGNSVLAEQHLTETGKKPGLERLPENVMRHIDKPTFHSGVRPLTSIIRTHGIELLFEDGAVGYIDRSNKPIDASEQMARINQRRRRASENRTWYMTLVHWLSAESSLESAMQFEATWELTDRLFIIRRLTEGHTEEDIKEEMERLNQQNLEIIILSSSVVPIIAGGATVTSTVGPQITRTTTRGVSARALERAGLMKMSKAAQARFLSIRALRSQALEQLALARARGGAIVVDIGGKGQSKGAINLNPNRSSVEINPKWPNHVNGNGEQIAELFPPGSIDEIFASKLPGDVNWSRIAEGARIVLKPGGRISLSGLGGGWAPIFNALRKAGFRNLEVISDTLVKAIL